MKLNYINQKCYDMFDSMASTLGSGVVGGILGMALQDQNNQNQLSQQRQLNQLNLDYFKQTSDVNLQNQLKLWEQTNYPAQVAQLEKAGLNPALLYAKGGMGGSTGANAGVSGGSQAPSSAGANVAMASQMMNLQLVKAQAENINADTELKKQQAADTAGSAANRPLQGQNLQAQTASITQGIENQKAQQQLTEVQTKIANVQADVQSASKEEQIGIIINTMNKLSAETVNIGYENDILDNSWKSRVDLVKQQVIQMGAQTMLMQSQTGLNEAQAQNMAKQIALGYDQLKNSKDQTAIQKQLADFQTSFGNQAAQILGNLLHAGTSIYGVNKITGN